MTEQTGNAQKVIRWLPFSETAGEGRGKKPIYGTVNQWTDGIVTKNTESGIVKLKPEEIDAIDWSNARPGPGAQKP